MYITVYIYNYICVNTLSIHTLSHYDRVLRHGLAATGDTNVSYFSGYWTTATAQPHCSRSSAKRFLHSMFCSVQIVLSSEASYLSCVPEVSVVLLN